MRIDVLKHDFKYKVLIGLIGVNLPFFVSADEDVATGTLIKKRVEQEQKVENNPFVITPYRANYILPVTYSLSPNQKPFDESEEFGDNELQRFEAKFQISFKMPLAEDFLWGKGNLFFAYTNQSWWQVYNTSTSAPFRETVHEPELFMVFANEFQLGRFQSHYWVLGIDHQSNGQSSTLSRSWNRIYGDLIFDSDPFSFDIKAWWRIPEGKKSTDSDPAGDDNPDINHYMGNVEATGLYGIGEHRFTMLLRDNFDVNDNKGAVQLTYSYPIHRNIRLYLQYFNGYGESLIDYNSHIERLGIGVAINDLF